MSEKTLLEIRPAGTQVDVYTGGRDALLLWGQLVSGPAAVVGHVPVYAGADVIDWSDPAVLLAGTFVDTAGDTMTGDLVMQGADVVPSADATGNLGAPATRWAGLYAAAATIAALTATTLAGTLQTQAQPNVTSLGAQAASFLPNVDNGLTLGSALYRWANLHATSLTGTLATATQPNVTSLGTLTGLSIGANPSIGATLNLSENFSVFAYKASGAVNRNVISENVITGAGVLDIGDNVGGRWSDVRIHAGTPSGLVIAGDTVTFAGTVIGPNGSAASPPYGFTNAPGYGMYYGSSALRLVASGADVILLGSAGNVTILNTLLFGSAGDTNLYRASANNLKTDDAFTAAGITSLGAVAITQDSSNVLTLNKTTGPNILFNKTTATAQSWSLTGEGSQFVLYDVTRASATPFKVSTAGLVTLEALSVTGTSTLTGALAVASTGPHVFGGALANNHRFRVMGSFLSGGIASTANGFANEGSITGAIGDTSWQVGAFFGTAHTTQGAAETISIVAQAYFREPDITVVAGDTVTTAATVYIAGAPTEGVANWSLAVASGNSWIAGPLSIGTGSVTSSALRLGDTFSLVWSDVNLYRASANVLKTDDALHAAGLKVTGDPGATVGAIRYTGALVIQPGATGFHIVDSTNARVNLKVSEAGDTTTYAGLYIGAIADVYLSRGAANRLDLGSGDSLYLSGGGDIALAGTGTLRKNTADTADNERMLIAGGGAISDSRGAYLDLRGNEYATDGGSAKFNLGGVTGAYFGVVTGLSELRYTRPGNLLLGGTADRATTVGTNAIHVFNGTAPVGTLTNGVSFYSAAGEAYAMDAAGNATLLSPHDSVTNEWIFRSKHTPTGKVLKIRTEALLNALIEAVGLDRDTFISEYLEA